MEIQTWRIDPLLKSELDNHYQARKSYEMMSHPPEEIIGMYTFSYGAPRLTLDGASDFISFVEKVIGMKISGTGAELGAGPGTHAALLAMRPRVDLVYAVEASEPIVRNLMPVVVPFIAKDKKNKVIGVVGDFAHLDLPDSSLDFVFDFFSLHHTPDLGNTMVEIYRVLKPGGFVFCFDKARNDTMSDSDLEKLLDVEYSAEFKKKMGIAPSVYHTRRMNGENEYRRKDWLKYMSSAGFKKSKHFNIARTISHNRLVKLSKNIFSLLPPRFQAYITSLLPLKPTSDISPKERIYSPLVDFYQKEVSLIIGYK